MSILTYFIIFLVLIFLFSSQESFSLKYFTKPLPKLKPYIPLEKTIENRKSKLIQN